MQGKDATGVVLYQVLSLRIYNHAKAGQADGKTYLGVKKMANEKRLIDFEKARESVMEILAGKVTTPIAVKVSIAMQNATVDAVEVVHGRWIADGWFTKRCSVCHSTPLRENGGRHDACYSNYCPHCGAKMDGDGNG